MNKKYPYVTFNEYMDRVGSFCEDGNKKSGKKVTIKDDTNKKRIAEEDERLKRIKDDSALQSCDGELLLSQLKKRRLDSSLLNSKTLCI